MKIDASEYINSRVYLSMPIAADAPRGGNANSFFTVSTGGRVADTQELALSDSPGALLFPYPVEVGEDGIISIDFYDEPGGSRIPDPDFCRRIALTREPCDADTLYSEPLRPLVHFTPARGFMNDPNGLIYYGGRYFLFFQLNPYGVSHGNTHWGLAVSGDLLHWRELPTVLAPDASGMMFSGSGVVDYNNTSGLQTGEHPPIFLFYTATGMRFFPRFPRDPETGRPVPPEGWKRPETTQRCAVSLDGGNTFEKIDRVLIHETAPMNRDPKVVWNGSAGAWMMALYLSGNDYTLFFSDDLLNWERGETFTFDGTGECPDVFELPLDGDRTNMKWVIFGSPENYIIGHFEGRKFIAETPLIKGCTQPESGAGHVFTSSALYAPQTFFGDPQGRMIQISWMPTVFPGMKFQSQMSLPWELKLVSTGRGMRLAKLPASECESLRGNEVRFDSREPDWRSRLAGLSGEALEICFSAKFENPHGGGFAVSVRGEPIVYDHALRRITLATGDFAMPFAEDGSVDFRIICDRGSVELFACGGLFNCGLNAPLDPSRKSAEFFYNRGCEVSGEAYILG